MNEFKWSAPGDQETVLLPFAIEVYAHLAEPDRRLPATVYVPAVELSLQLLVTRLFNDAVRSRQLLREYVPAFADRPNLDDKQRFSRVDDIFWELSDNNGPPSTYFLNPLDADLRRILEGEQRRMQIGIWAFQGGDFPLVRISCETFEFIYGSLRGRIGGYLSGTALLLSLLFAAASTPFGEGYAHRAEIQQTFSSLYAGEPCLTEARLTINASDLLDATAREFNFKAQGLSVAAQKRSVCLVQLATDFSGHSPGPIDGFFGPRSELALRAFQREHNLQHTDVTAAELQRELAKAFHKGLTDMAR